eukprot:gene11117-19702_t
MVVGQMLWLVIRNILVSNLQMDTIPKQLNTTAIIV